MTLSHLLPFSLLLLPLAWGIFGYTKARKEKTSIVTKQSAFPLALNSAILYALAFNIIFFIQELFLAAGKYWLGLDAVLYHNNHSWEGYHPMEGLVQGYGAAAIFVCGFIFFAIAASMKNSGGFGRPFFTWMGFQGLAQSIPQFITGKIAPDTDTGQAFTYLGIDDTMGLFISIAGVIGMLVLAIYTGSSFLKMAPSEQHTYSAKARFNYLWKIALFPALIGIVLIFPFRIMPFDRALAPVFVTLFSVPMIFFHAWKLKPRNTVKNIINQRFLVLPLVLLLILLLIFQLVLAPGIAL